MGSDNTDSVDDMPPSVKLVVKTLQHEGPLTQKELCESTLLTSRTARYALNRLEEVDMLNSEPSIADARQNIYSLPDNLTTEQNSSRSNRTEDDRPADGRPNNINSGSTEDRQILDEIKSAFETIDS